MYVYYLPPEKIFSQNFSRLQNGSVWNSLKKNLINLDIESSDTYATVQKR